MILTRRCEASLSAGLWVLVVAVIALGVAGASPAMGAPANIAVTDTAQIPYQVQNVARDPARPGHLAVAIQDGSPPGSPGRDTCFVALSADAGATWRLVSLVGKGGQFALPPLPGAPPNVCWLGYVAYGPDGTLYYSFQDTARDFSYNSVMFMRSVDGGDSFTAPMNVDSNQPPPTSPDGGGEYGQHMAVDQHNGHVYLATTRANVNFDSLAPVLFSSTDGGKSFSGLTAIAGAGTGLNNLSPVVGVDGKVSVSWVDGSGPGPAFPLRIATSPDGVQPFEASVKVADTFSCALCLSSELRGQPRPPFDPPTQALAAGPAPGQLVLVWDGPSSDSSGLRHQIHVASSRDGGTGWSPSQVIGKPIGLDTYEQARPNVTVSPGGRIFVDYYNIDSNEQFEDTYLTSSSDGALTFSSPVRVSDVSSNIGPPFRPATDYFHNVGLASDDSSVYTAWTDSRRGSLANLNNDGFPKQDGFFAGLSFAAPPPATVSPPTVPPGPVPATRPPSVFVRQRANVSVRGRRVGRRQFIISGRIIPPVALINAGFSRAAICGAPASRVSVQTKRGSTTLSTRRRTLRSNCTYSVRVRFANTRRFGSASRLKFTVRFLGNRFLSPKTARAINVRLARR